MIEIIFVLIFFGVVGGLFYYVVRVLGDDYDKKPLKYEEIKKDKKINQYKNMENQQLEVKESKDIQLKWNKLSITGFVLSIVSIFGLGLAGLVGFIMGIVALTQIKHTKERGKGFAISAIIIGFIWSVAISILRRLVEAGY